MKRILYSSLALLLVLIACSKDEEPVPPPTPKFSITITAGDGGSVSTSGGTYDKGTKVNVTATPDGEFLFDKWSDGNTDNPREITVSSNLNLSASFVKKKYALIVNVEGEGTVEEEIIVQGSTSTTEYNSGTTIKLTATPSDEWVFSGWSGAIESTDNPIEVSVDEAKEITATFKLKQYELTINIEGEGTVSETIVTQPSLYDSGTVIQLEAIPSDGWRFESWVSEEIDEGDRFKNPIDLTIISNTEISVKFVPKFILFSKSLGEGTIESEVISSNDEFTTVRLKATASQNWKFSRWQGDIRSSEDEIVVDIYEPMEINASFIQSNNEFEVFKSYFEIPYSYKNYLLYNVGGGKRYFEIDGDEYLIVSSDFSDSHLLKKNNERWSLIDVFESPVSGLPENNYRGMGPIVPISSNEYIVSSNGEADTDPSTWGAYVYQGKIENDNLSYHRITDFKDYYYGSTYGDITGDGLGDIISSYVFTNNGDGSYTQHNITNNTVNNQGLSITQFNTGLDLINLDRYLELNPSIGQKITDLYPGGRDEIIFSFIDVSDRVSEEEIVPRGDVLIYEFSETTQKYEVVFELPRRIVGEVESSEGIEVYDINNDGINDILLSISTGDPERLQPFEVWLGNSDKTFTKHFEFERQSFVGGGEYYVMDVNNDGFLDLTLLPVGDNADWIQNWCLDCSDRQEQGLPIKDGLRLQNAIWLNDGTGRFNVLNKELTIQNSFVVWLLPYMKDGNLNYIGAEYNYIDGEIMEIEVLNIEVKSNFFN